MSRLCLACSGPVPDLPTEVPLRYCSQSCQSRVDAAARRLVAAIAADPGETVGDEGTQR